MPSSNISFFLKFIKKRSFYYHVKYKYYVNYFLAFLLIIPLAIDGGLQYLGFFTSNNPRRFVTGILGGIATIIFLKSAIDLGYYHGKIVKNWLK
ncbi:Predicted membrane protein [Anaerobranca californiensis DSM 14826]|jgi:uncharacterized membrane protein|uniref:Predicted membrane protein n=1 Tax=Anaerobranca californiensis DSM 14826 TaxID=1120989 RepID=A0A1M6MW43_9FIRM|nr:DUF2085 domain-containing protein [Anaerobranca californiensis]SHJ87619.1 Predicted membrane protein [Anaerobranca californiensis DSM 14826]